jgi:NAD-dependent dihydropyrimidine dehydrogenase PreA subunit
MIPRIDSELCTECGECVDACPGQVFTKGEEGVNVAYPEECIECRACEEVCPVEAVRLVDVG